MNAPSLSSKYMKQSLDRSTRLGALFLSAKFIMLCRAAAPSARFFATCRSVVTREPGINCYKRASGAAAAVQARPD